MILGEIIQQLLVRMAISQFLILNSQFNNYGFTRI